MRMKGIWHEHDGLIMEERQKGKTLQELGDEFEVTRERIRQLLQGHYGTTEFSHLVSESRLAKRLKVSAWTLGRWRRKNKLPEDVKMVKVGNTHYHFYKVEDIPKLVQFFEGKKTCPGCGGVMILGSQYCRRCWNICSIRYSTEEARERHRGSCRESMRRRRSK